MIRLGVAVSVLGVLAPLACFGAVAPPSASAVARAAAAKLCTSTPLTSTSKTRYRLPAVVATGGGHVLLFAERRNNISGTDTDTGDFDIVLTTSANNGCTWSKPAVVVNNGKGPASNPVPIYDSARSRVLLVATVKTTKNYLYQRAFSTTGKALGDRRLIDLGDAWRPGLSGTGHGTVLTTGPHTGRLLLAFGYTRSDQGDKRATRGIYSDDGGSTWHLGYDRVSPGKLQLIEGTMTQLASGSLLVSYRDNGKGLTTPGRNRVSAISTDSGASVGGYTAMKGVTTVPVGGSLLQTTTGRRLVLFSSPSNTSGKITSRRGMRIFTSANGVSWHKALAVGSTTDPACYSDLTQLSPSVIGLAYENGYTAKKPYWNRIVFRQLSLTAIENA